MRTRWTFHDCDDLIKTEVEAYWSRKAPRLERLLATFPDSLHDLSISLYRHRARGSFEGRTVLQLPSHTLVASASEADHRAVIDRLVDLLATEIKRHRARLRHDWVYRRKNRRRDELTAAGPLLAQDRQERRREAFFELLLPILRPLKEHARRELRLLEQQGLVGRGEVSAGDVIGEVVLRAWEEFDDRPPGWDLDVWLMDLMDDFLNKLRNEPRPERLTGRRVAAAIDREGDDATSSAMTMEQLLPGDEGGQPWEDLGKVEQQSRIDRLLRTMPGARRDAFLQFFLEGFDAAEIAMIQDRPESEVRADIEIARQALKGLLRRPSDEPADAPRSAPVAITAEAGAVK